MTDRGVSTVLGYVLTLGIVTLLVGGLFVAAGDYVGDQHERAIRAEFEVIGNRIAADVAAVDRLALAAGSDGEASLRTDLPAQAAGKAYEISITSVAGYGNVSALTLTTTDPSVTVEVRVRTSTSLAEGTISGGDVRVVFDGSQLEVRNA